MDASYFSERASRRRIDPAFERAFDRAATDLQDIIHVIAERYMLRGAPLTWRLLHEIETEALADLGLASRHDEALLAMFVRPTAGAYPCTDTAVTVRANCPVPLLFWFVLDVYGIPALSAQAPPKTAATFFTHAESALLRYA